MSQEEEATCVVGEDRLTCIPGSPLFGSLYGWSDPAVHKAEMAKFVAAAALKKQQEEEAVNAAQIQ